MEIKGGWKDITYDLGGPVQNPLSLGFGKLGRRFVTSALVKAWGGGGDWVTDLTPIR